VKSILPHTTGLLLAAGLLCAATPPESPLTVELQFQTLRNFDISLPAETFVPIKGTLPFVGAPDGQLTVKVTDEGLAFDRNGDGTLDATVTDPDKDHPTRLVTFRLEGGAEYAVRVKHDGPWSTAPGGAMVGRIGSERIMLLDQNGNGRFDDFGADAMVLGRGKVASFLSRVVPVDGKLFELDVTADGTGASLTPYVGPTGTLDLGTNFETKAKLRSVVLTSAQGDLSFELSGAVAAKEAIRLPAGEYRIYTGEVVLGKSHAQLAAGRAKPLEVAAGGNTSFTWGGPVQAEFRYKRSGGELQIGPSDIEYFGRAGELYSSFMPLGSSPHFEVKEKATGDVLVDMVFPGNC
jgi:hypothetical protein